ncbi:MAG TPA: hypothetical protein VJN18_20480 [Polyangiaceae bacterium]|nr:hypothetical protein [Polyangiaceae bacterium]
MTRPSALALLLAMGGCVPAEREPGRERPRGATKQVHAPRVGLVTAGSAKPVRAPTDGALPQKLPVLSQPFRDDFERDSIGDDYLATGNQYRIERGRLCVKGARNHPLWLRHRLPLNARIEVEAETSSNDGDIKLEAWGDGEGAATRVSYDDATSYLAILGGWKNRFHVLARLDEHAPDRPEVVIEPGSDDTREQPVLKGRRYHLKLERSDGRTVRFWVDDVQLLSFIDPAPLAGGGHDHFAFNNWETPVCFDNLRVEPLPS